MLRAALVSLCGLLLRIFFRRIEVVGEHHLPKEGSLLFALNHPSGLIDPLFILCLSGRPVSFLAKEPLFRMPVISTFVKAFESLPVYRAVDGADPVRNKAMLRAASDLLARGNALALFPEGTSHSDPGLKRFRSGAARIALAARVLGQRPVRLVPCALYYERKQTFRSRAVLAFGAPLSAPSVVLNENGDPPIEVAQALTTELENAIVALMPTADTAEALLRAEQAERVFSAALRDTPDRCPRACEYLDDEGRSGGAATLLTLAERMERRRRLLFAYGELVERHPQEIKSVLEKISSLAAQLEYAGLSIDAAEEAHPALRNRRAMLIAGSLFLLVPALVGAIVHAPAYQLIRLIAFRVSAQAADITATAKLLAGLLFFPFTWLALGCAGAVVFANGAGWLLVFVGPPTGWAAIALSEISGALLRHKAARRTAKRGALDWSRVIHERAKIAEEMAQLLRNA